MNLPVYNCRNMVPVAVSTMTVLPLTLSTSTILVLTCRFLTMTGLLNSVASATESLAEGHLKPLGSHRPPESPMLVLDHFPNPKEFFEEFVHPSKPVVFKNVAKGIPAYQLWTDRYLKDTYGDLPVDCEDGKKENRSQNVLEMTMSEFLDIYKTQDIYMVQDVHPEMRVDLSLPRFLQCGGFQDVLELSVLWFSSGGTKSVLHSDSVDNVNCVFDGWKEFILIDKKYEDDVEADNFVTNGGYSRVDVERVDFTKFPSLANLPWWLARLEAGDCLFLPQGWYHTAASSPTRNLAVNLWLVHLLWFNQTDCDQMDVPLMDYKPLHTCSVATFMGHGEGSVEKLRHGIFSPFEGLDKIGIEDATEVWNAEHSDVHAVFEVLDANKDLDLSWEEVFQANLLELLRDFPFLIPEIDPEDSEVLQEWLHETDAEEEEMWERHHEL